MRETVAEVAIPCVISERTKVDEDEQLDMARRNPNEGSVMSLQSGLFKLLLPLPNVAQTSLAKRLAPGGESKEDNAVLFLLHPRQPLSMIAVSLCVLCLPCQAILRPDAHPHLLLPVLTRRRSYKLNSPGKTALPSRSASTARRKA